MRSLLFIFLLSFLVSCSQEKEKTVFLAILARNQGHFLPRYLQTLENLDYDKKRMTVYINTNNNEDDTKEILEEWIVKNRQHYQNILYEAHELAALDETPPHDWSLGRLKVMGQIRNRSIQLAKESKVDYYFVADCDNFIAPHTLKTLMDKDKPIIAPLLYSIPDKQDFNCTYYCAVDERGYYCEHPYYWSIFFREKKGTFIVPLVHATYLIKGEYLDRLTYEDGTDEMEFIIFSNSARSNGIEQYICNECDFGVQFAFLDKTITREEEKKRVKAFLTIP